MKNNPNGEEMDKTVKDLHTSVRIICAHALTYGEYIFAETPCNFGEFLAKSGARYKSLKDASLDEMYSILESEFQTMQQVRRVMRAIVEKYKSTTSDNSNPSIH